MNLVLFELIENVRLYRAGVDRLGDKGPKLVSPATVVDEAVTGRVGALLFQQRDHLLVKLPPQLAAADNLARPIMHRLYFGLGGKHRLLAGDAGARNDFHAGAFFNGSD